MTQIGFTYNGGSHCIRHHSEAILEGTVTVSVEDEEMTYDSEGNETYPVWDTDDDAKDFQCEECLDEEIAKRDDPSAPAPSEHTPREIADFLIDEFLQPAGESVIYSDYRMQYEDEGHGTREEFDQRYNEGVALLRAAPELLEALEKLLVLGDRLNFDTYHIPGMRHPNGSSCEWKEQVDARDALAKAKGEHQ